MTACGLAFYTLRMDAKTIIDNLGGQSAVRELTGLSKGRISQWWTGNHIPRSWLLYLSEKRPEAFQPPNIVLPSAADGVIRQSD